MILTIIDTIQDYLKHISSFIEKNAANPFFWIILFLVLLVLCYFTINHLGDK